MVGRASWSWRLYIESKVSDGLVWMPRWLLEEACQEPEDILGIGCKMTFAERRIELTQGAVGQKRSQV